MLHLMESILAIDIKNNPELLDDFEGMEPGDKIKVTAEFTISELSENRASLPMNALSSVSLINGDNEEDNEEDESEEPEETEGAGS